MTGIEERQIKVTALTGLTDLCIGLIMFLTGWHHWYFEHFHFAGYIGISMLAFAFWHMRLYRQETGNRLWMKKKRLS